MLVEIGGRRVARAVVLVILRRRSAAGEGADGVTAACGGDVPQAARSRAHAARAARPANEVARHPGPTIYHSPPPWPPISLRGIRPCGRGPSCRATSGSSRAAGTSTSNGAAGARARSRSAAARSSCASGVEPRGIFGAGYTLTAPQERAALAPEKAAQGATTQYLKLRLDTLLELPPVTYADLAVPPFARFRWGVRQSGTQRADRARRRAGEPVGGAASTSASSRPSRAGRSRA